MYEPPSDDDCICFDEIDVIYYPGGYMVWTEIHVTSQDDTPEVTPGDNYD